MRNIRREIRGGIKPLEMAAFKHKVRILDKLKCYKPRRKADDAVELATMVVIGIYPHILTLSYQGRNHQRLYTSMTWAEDVQLNRMTQDELFEEVVLMQQERGLLAYSGLMKETEPKKRSKPHREKYVSAVVAYRDHGMTYAKIASALGVSTSFVRDIYLSEGMRNKKHS